MQTDLHPLMLYSCFHLNLAFSSIEGRERSRVLDQCYWPLLKIVNKLKLQVGIEANASTLEMIHEIDPSWIDYMRALIDQGLVEVIGSGFVQLIGPLVPVEVNRANLRIGNEIYKEMFGVCPTIALVNEQAYSPGLIPLYREAGYEAIIMDWANPFTHHDDWDAQWLYAPQNVLGADGSTMNILWNDSIPFQKFQRYVYEVISLEYYLSYLSEHLSTGIRAFPIYGNDIEVFDFRPNRYRNEEKESGKEWERIGELFAALIEDPRFDFVSPSNVLKSVTNGQHVLSLESPNDPVPVKKQPKYNITRWAVSGRDDIWANTACWRLYQQMITDGVSSNEQWKSICLKWRSDYRTHITETRWNMFAWDVSDSLHNHLQVEPPIEDDYLPFIEGVNNLENFFPFEISRNHNFLLIKTKTSEINLNLRRGMAIQSYVVPKMGSDRIYGTLPHGYYSDIKWAADYYSAHLIAELAGLPKVCDLERVEPEFSLSPDKTVLKFRSEISTILGPIIKVMSFYFDQPRVDVAYYLNWPNMQPGNLRIGNVTLNPRLFDRESLFFKTHNGGPVPERHSLAEVDVDHGGAVSFSTSARSGLGMTEGTLLLGDNKRTVEISVDLAKSAMIGMVTCKKVSDEYFCRASLSAFELDETSRLEGPFIDIQGRNKYEFSILVADTETD